MHTCNNCGHLFEGNFCPECGTQWQEEKTCPNCGATLSGNVKFCNECGYSFMGTAQPSAPAQSRPQTAIPQILLKVCRILPTALFALLSVLIFAFLAAPLVKANMLGMTDSRSGYGVLGEETLNSLHGGIIALIVFAALGCLISLIMILRKINTKTYQTKRSVFYLLFYLVYLIIPCVLCGDINSSEEMLVMFTAGAAVILPIVFSCIFLVLTVCCMVGERLLPQEQQQETAAKAVKKPSIKFTWIKKHKGLVVFLSLVLVVATVLLSLIPTFILASKNGTYYQVVNGELSEKSFLTLKTGKCIDGDEVGKYELSGDTITIYFKDDFTGSWEVMAKGSISNGVMKLESPSTKTKMVLCNPDSHKHAYGKWEETKAATCIEGEEMHTCTACGMTETQVISANKSHKYGEWKTTKEPTCTEKGEQSSTCSVCNNKATQAIPATGHTYGEWKTIKEPTCINNGERTSTCLVCSKQETQSIPTNNNHTYVDGICTVCKTYQVQYTLSDDGKYYSVTGLNNTKAPNITILYKINNIPVTSIDGEAFSGCSSLTSVIIPDSITSIDRAAFKYCSKLEKVYYKGVAEDWKKISIGLDNTRLINATKYYYSETKPTTSGNYWHYVDGKVVEW